MNRSASDDLLDMRSPSIFLPPEQVKKCGWNPKTWCRCLNCKVLRKEWPRLLKIVLLFVVWFAFTTLLMMHEEHHKTEDLIVVPPQKIQHFWQLKQPTHTEFQFEIKGPFYNTFEEQEGEENYLYITVNLVNIKEDRMKGVRKKTEAEEDDIEYKSNVNETWKVGIRNATSSHTKLVTLTKRYAVKGFELGDTSANTVIHFRMEHSLSVCFGLRFNLELSPVDSTMGVVYAALVLLGLYVLILFEIVHRALAAIIASTMAVAILAFYNQEPTMAEMMAWIDTETLLLLFSMMLLIAIVSKTGIFDFLAVIAFRMTKGRIWPLIMTISLFTGFLTSIMDNVTTVLLTTPVTIKLCEMLKLNPVPVLMTMIMYCNVFGALTPVGNPPNVIIANTADVQAANVQFYTFIMHTVVCVTSVSLLLFVLLRFVVYRNPDKLVYSEEVELEELQHEVVMLRRTASMMSTYTRDDEVTLKKALVTEAKRKQHEMIMRRSSMMVTGQMMMQRESVRTAEEYKTMLAELQEKYYIRNYPLLIKSGLAMGFAITFFFAHSFPEIDMSLGWIALMAAIMLLILADREDLEGAVAHVEWTTLVFFAALFVLMEALTHLGLIQFIGDQTVAVILSVAPEHQLTVALLLILWVSAISSALIDNIPLGTMMVKIIVDLSKNPKLTLELQPLVWALVFGVCFGGNGTLIGSSANVVCSGLAEQHGYKISFFYFFKIGFPITLATLTVATIYLLVAHVAMNWIT